MLPTKKSCLNFIESGPFATKMFAWGKTVHKWAASVKVKLDVPCSLPFSRISVKTFKKIVKSSFVSESKWKGHFQPARLLWPRKYLSNFLRPRSSMIFCPPIRTCALCCKSLQDTSPDFIQSLRYNVWTLFFWNVHVNQNGLAFQNSKKYNFSL